MVVDKGIQLDVGSNGCYPSLEDDMLANKKKTLNIILMRRRN